MNKNKPQENTKDFLPRIPRDFEVFKELKNRDNKSVLYHNGTLLDDKTTNDIIRKAKDLLMDELLKSVMVTISHEGARKIYYESTSLEDIAFGKGLIEAMDRLEKKLFKLSEFK